MLAKKLNKGRLRSLIHSLLTVTVVGGTLVLAGCSSTPSGPTKQDILKGLAQQAALKLGDSKGQYAKEKKFADLFDGNLHVQKCAKTGLVTWTCDYDFRETNGRTNDDESIKLRREGGKWDYVPGSFRALGDGISRN
jgi:hypothetical protein